MEIQILRQHTVDHFSKP